MFQTCRALFKAISATALILGELHLSYIDSLIENGTNFRVDRKDETASFRPASDSEADLQAFQPVVRDLRAHQGDGYEILVEHALSDHGDGLVDLVLVTLDHD